MNLSESDAAYAADQFIDYFSNLGRIDEYLRNSKIRSYVKDADISSWLWA